MRIYRFKIPLTSIYIDSSVFNRAPKRYEDQFGVYCFSAKQGLGKTYSAVRWLHGFFDTSELKVYANLKTIKNFKYTYENDLDRILANREKNVVFFIDEIFKKIDPNDKRKISQLTQWLGQSRKHRRIVIFTTQEWLDLPISLRRFCRRSISIQKLPFSLRILRWGDAENMIYDKETSEYTCPVVSTELIRISKKITKLYDTFEAIE